MPYKIMNIDKGMYLITTLLAKIYYEMVKFVGTYIYYEWLMDTMLQALRNNLIKYVKS